MGKERKERGVSRRGFLQRTAAAGAAAAGFPCLVPASALGRSGNVAPSNRITLGFIGIGKMAKGHLGGFLGDRNAARLAALLSDPDTPVAAAAAEGLGKLGGPEAVAALTEALDAPEPVRAAVVDALLCCADALLERGRNEAAAKLYWPFYRNEEETHVRLAGFRGLVEARAAGGVSFVVAALASDDPVWQVAAMRYVRTVPGEQATERLVETLDGLAPQMLALAVEALGDRGDPAALPAVTELLESGAAPVRLAAIQAVKKLGNGSSVEPLTQIALAGEDPARSAARNALAGLNGPDVNKTLVEQLEQSSRETTVMLLDVLAERRAYEAAPVVMGQARRENEEVRAAAYDALGVLARRMDMPELVSLLVKTPKDDRDYAQGAVVDAARRMPEGEARTEAVLDALADAENPEVRAALLKVLGGIGGPTGLEALRAGAESESATVRMAAIVALAEWPTDAPLPTLARLAKNAPEPVEREEALLGYVRALRMTGGEKPRAAAEGLEQALNLAGSAEAKRAALSALGTLKDAYALEVVRQYLEDAEVEAEAAVAAERIRRHFYEATASRNAARAGRALDGDIGTRWDTGAFQEPGQWFQLDLGGQMAVRGIYLDTSRSENDYPRGYEVYVFTDESGLGGPVASGEGDKAVMEITWEPVRGRFLRIVQTGSVDNKYWSIHELRVIPE